jgi:hypothetical protein
VPDQETNALVIALASDRKKWSDAHAVFDRVRRRLLEADKHGDRIKHWQYGFEEACLKTLYNESYPVDPFDACSPFWVAGCAIGLARVSGVPVPDVVAIIAPQSTESD